MSERKNIFPAPTDGSTPRALHEALYSAIAPYSSAPYAVTMTDADAPLM